MDMFDLAGLLFGSNRANQDAATVTATGAASSEDGVASITMDADVTPAEDVDEDADQTIIDLPTSPDVDEGDEVIVTLVGDGPLKTPVVTANPGAGDRMRALANSAKTIADAAQAVAEAVNQHFWHDDNGAHVTEATQEEWEQSHSGPNSLWNSLGMLFRDGLNNLLALVGGSNPGVAIYDGNGNDADNVVASFDKDGIGLVGGAFRLTSERVTEEYGDESNPTTSTEIRSIMKSEGSNDDFETRCFLRSVVGEDDDAYYNSIELTSETDIKTQFPTETNNASVEVGSDQWVSSVRLVADSQELHLHKHPVNSKDYFDLHSEVFLITDYHNGVCVFSTMPGTVLWSSGGWAMAADQTATLAYNVSTCPTGIVLHWQPYTSSTVRNYYHHWQFVPKEQVASYAGTTVDVTLSSSKFASIATKTLYVSDNRVTGHADNTATGTANGITYANNQWVLTQIIAV